ncbi:hypothetical protein C2E23DRAFT_883370 [Lenzites betulinus]|nr:hypothetical protein C2E23DRAFT_883370 [Lenzites betulinus]
MALILSPTRSGQRASLSESAYSVPERRDVRITSLDALQNFVTLGNYNANIGRIVEDLVICLPGNQGYPAQDVRAALRLTPNIECLVLELPPESPTSLLNGLDFVRLRIFSTNLPHRVLLSFLVTHSSLNALILRGCGRSATCPLRDFELPSLSSLQCPSRCFAGIIRGPLISATVNLSRLSSMSALAVQTISSSRLHTLTVDHFSTDYDILARVAAAAPNLRKLKLNEKPIPGRRHGQLRRPWNDVRAWHAALLQLASLEELMVRALISIGSPNRPEISIIAGWANGVGRRAVPHPNLYHIAIIQKDVQGGAGAQQQLSHWFKRETGTWALATSTTLGASQSFSL